VAAAPVLAGALLAGALLAGALLAGTVLAVAVLAVAVLAAGAGALVRVSVAAVPVPPGELFILGSSSLVAPLRRPRTVRS
jgi:hypothetical protein